MAKKLEKEIFVPGRLETRIASASDAKRWAAAKAHLNPAVSEKDGFFFVSWDKVDPDNLPVWGTRI